MVTWKDCGTMEKHTSIVATADDGAIVITHPFHNYGGEYHVEGRRRYYVYGPAGVTDWLGSEEEAKAAYERMTKRRAR